MSPQLPEVPQTPPLLPREQVQRRRLLGCAARRVPACLCGSSSTNERRPQSRKGRESGRAGDDLERTKEPAEKPETERLREKDGRGAERGEDPGEGDRAPTAGAGSGPAFIGCSQSDPSGSNSRQWLDRLQTPDPAQRTNPSSSLLAYVTCPHPPPSATPQQTKAFIGSDFRSFPNSPALSVVGKVQSSSP